jgi:adenylate cyclase, class 2
MNQEFETKVLNIDTKEILSRLRAIGASEQAEFLSKRYVYDLGTDAVEWIRLRQQGTKSPTLTYKYKQKDNLLIGQTIEIEVEVSDFAKTAEIMNKLNFKEVFYQENKSHIFTLDDLEFSIDTWPMLPTYLEVEAQSVDRVQDGLELLGLKGKDIGDKDIKLMYQELGIDLHSYKQLRFE